MLNTTMLNTIAGTLGRVVTQAAEAGGTIVGIRHGTEEPAFTVERRLGEVEIRRYGERIAAQTEVAADEEPARNEGFRRLAGYIFGGNSGKAKIAMTAPVAQQTGEKIAMTAPVAAERGAAGRWVIRFFMPSSYTMETLPTPNDDRVSLVPVPPQTVAVLRFSGVATAAAIATRTTELLETLRRHDITAAGEPLMWFYDPPWTIPFRRRNEIVVAVADNP